MSVVTGNLAVGSVILTAVSTRFIGKRIARREDARFLTGHGCYVDDIQLPNTLHVAFARSDVARGRIVSIDTTAAAAMPGVVAVYVASDLNHLVHSYLVDDELVPGHRHRGFRVLADGDVRFVGDPIAMVVADSRYRAEDAVDAIEIDIDALPPVLDYERALDDEAPVVHPEAGSNLHGSIPAGETPELDALIESAPVVMTETFRQHRYAAVPMEPRGTLASWDPFRQDLTVWISTQGPHGVRGSLRAGARHRRRSGAGRHARRRGRVRAQDVPVAGGGRGRARDAISCGRPVKWIQDRRENLMCDQHAREDQATVTFAADDDGRLLGAKVDFLESAGAFAVAVEQRGGALRRWCSPVRIDSPRSRRRPAPCTRTRRAVVATGVRGCSRPSRASR